MSDSDQESYVRNQQRVTELEQRQARIRALNDQFRQTFAGGYVTVTAGVRAIDPERLSAILLSVRTYDQFGEGNDPYHEHDFGCVEKAGYNVFWKIDYYDKRLEMGSPDPADTRVTARVLTIMLASEY